VFGSLVEEREDSVQQPGSTDTGTSAADRQSQLEHLNQAIRHAAELLPSQGPITAFVFLNPLQGLEHLPFDQAVQEGGRLFSCHPYLTEQQYRDLMAGDRIRSDDLWTVLQRDLADRGDELICPLVTRFDLRVAMLQFPIRFGTAEELRWFVAETDALTRIRHDAPPQLRSRLIDETKRWVMRDLRDGGDDTHRSPGPHSSFDQHLHDDLIRQFGESSIERWSDSKWESLSLRILWRVCRDGAEQVEKSVHHVFQPLRHRDALLRATGEDSDVPVDEMLIRFCAAFTDQGFAGWPLPHRDLGFYRAFFELYRSTGGALDRRLRELPRELTRLHAAGLEPMESILESLELLGVPESHWDDYITASLLALRGWAGVLWQMEVRGDRVALPAPPGTLAEYLAVRLILVRVALTQIAAEKAGFRGPLSELKFELHLEEPREEEAEVDGRAFQIFQLAQVLGWSPLALHQMKWEEWTALVGEIESFTNIERRRLFHLAFERRFRRQTLNAISIHSRAEPKRVESPSFQSVYCIDAREESFRRHLEEIAPDAETFGAAGFYGVAIYYRGVADAHFAALCPIVIRPLYWVTEEVIYTLEDENQRRARTRRVLGSAFHSVTVGSRGFASGAVLTAGLGVLASIPLVARVLFPRLAASVRKSAGKFVEAPRVTRLRLERTAEPAGPEGAHVGLTVNEMAGIGERMLRDIGLTTGFARLVIFVGHGSFCLNNPHKSAYDCGACSGSAGGPNARALAAILNDLRVRLIIANRGLTIPPDTVFLGALHNTCADSVSFYDLDLLPKTHLPDFEAARDKLEKTCERNAHERCRRFDSAPLNLSFADARLHVEGRSEDLAQTRPEFGNATNAICIVGRRARTRGLFLDRRSFMHSYDPLSDDADMTILGRILGAVVPVCEGINLQYFFSYIDPPGWACGTKLSHNVTSLMGVMDGAASDLRPGLPWQGVEIHEPIRLLFVIETTPEGILKIMARNELVNRIISNGWVQLALLDPHSSDICVYRNGHFEPYQAGIDALPKAASSLDWYRGWRRHMDFAEIVR
jgi:uncharacterized protein YbcC (UPF0753/DUF2309 family)